MSKEILEMAKDLGVKIQDSQEFLRFKSCKEKMDSDESLVNLRKEFDKIKEDLNEEISKEDSDKEKIKELSDSLRNMYEKINNNKSVSDYDIAKKELDNLVNKVNLIINESAHGKFDQSLFDSCSGSCSTCGGCF